MISFIFIALFIWKIQGGHFDPSRFLTLQQPSWPSKGKVADYRKERKIWQNGDYWLK